jgi:hypothetical protein
MLFKIFIVSFGGGLLDRTAILRAILDKELVEDRNWVLRE